MWQQWDQWCTALRFPVWLHPESERHSYQLALFAVYYWKYGWGRRGQGNAASTVLAKISHLAWHHQRVLGYTIKLLPGYRLAITGMRRVGAGPTRKAPVTTTLLKSIHQSLDFCETRGRVIWGATILGFFFLLRRSEYLAQGQKHASFIIQRRDVVFRDRVGSKCNQFDGIVSVTVRFRSSTTDQAGEGTTRTAGRSGTPWLCPVHATWFLVRHHESLCMPETTPLCTIAPGAIVQVSQVTRVIKQAATAIGEDPASYGTHSLRSGGATALFAAPVDDLAIKQFGRWKSDAFERYTRLDEKWTRALAHTKVEPSASSGGQMGNLHATPWQWRHR